MNNFLPCLQRSSRWNGGNDRLTMARNLDGCFPQLVIGLPARGGSLSSTYRPAAIRKGSGVTFTRAVIRVKHERTHSLIQLKHRASCRVFEHSARQISRVKFPASEAYGLGRNDGSQAVSCDTEKSGQLKVTLTELKERARCFQVREPASCDAGMFASESKERVI